MKILSAKQIKSSINKQIDALNKSKKQRAYALLILLSGMLLLINVKNVLNKSPSIIKTIIDVKLVQVEHSGIKHRRLAKSGVPRVSNWILKQMFVSKNATKVKATYTQINQRNANISVKKEPISIFRPNLASQFAIMSIFTILPQKSVKEIVVPRKFITRKMILALSAKSMST